MKNYFISFFIFLFLHVSAFSQTNVRDEFYYPNNVDFHLMYSGAYFYNINGSPVNLKGLSIGMFTGWADFFSINIDGSYFFPEEYNGQLIYSAMYDTIYPKEIIVENKVSGSGIALNFNITIHNKTLALISKSEDFAIYPQIGVTALAHTISYKNNPFSIGKLAYQVAWTQGVTLGTINFGIYSRLRIANVPFCLKISQNILFSSQNYHTKFVTKKDYSSYLNVGIGFTFPITKGPGVSKIKTIHYK